MTRSERYQRIMSALPIRTRDLHLRPLVFNQAQRRIWQEVAPKLDAKERLWFIVLKARREGVSTFVQALLLTKMVESDLVNGLVVAHEAPATKRIWKIGKLMVERSPLKDVARCVSNRIELAGSTLEIATAGSEASTRSADLTVAHLSEVGFWPKPEAMLAVLQCLPEHEDTICVVESTANGLAGIGTLFHDQWQAAIAGESDFAPIFIPWFVMPEYALPGLTLDQYDAEEVALMEQFKVTDAQLAWRRRTIATKCQGRVEQFHQEYPATPEEAFIQSGQPFFTQAELMPLQQHLEAGTVCRVEVSGRVIQDASGPLTVWKEPERGHQYVIGGDASMGLEGPQFSRSAAEVLDLETMEQVAEYDLNAAPHLFAQHLVGLARFYNDALLGPEVQAAGGGGGREVLVYIQQQNYWNLYRRTAPDKVNRDLSNLYGWETTVRTRPRVLARIREVVLERSAVVHSRRLVQQLTAFGQATATRMQALSGHDDLLFAWGIALMIRAETYLDTPLGATALGERARFEQLGIRTQKTLTEQQEAHWDKVFRKGMPVPTTYLTM